MISDWVNESNRKPRLAIAPRALWLSSKFRRIFANAIILTVD